MKEELFIFINLLKKPDSIIDIGFKIDFAYYINNFYNIFKCNYKNTINRVANFLNLRRILSFS